MAAAVDTTVIRHDRYIEGVPLKANTILRKGDLVLTQDADGYAVSAPAASCHVIGVATEDQDNTGGSSGDISIRVEQGEFLLKNSGSDAVVAADVAKKALVYAEDYQTACHTSAGKSPIGRVTGVNEFRNTSGTSLGVIVEIGPNS